MNLHQLRFVREAVRQNFNLTEAAKSLYTSQPGVSKAIIELEAELGIEIFVRHGKRLRGLTEPGRAVLKSIEHIMLEVDSLKKISKEYAAQDNGSLIIATTHTQARYALPEVIQSFMQQLPNVRLSLLQGDPAQIGKMVLSDQADIAIASELSANPEGLRTLPCYQWTHVLIAPLDHPILECSPLTLEEIARYPLITYDMVYSGRSRIEQAFQLRNVKPDIVLEAIDADVIKTYVELGLGVGIISELAYKPERDPLLRAVPAGHLFGTNIARIAVKEGAYLRSFVYTFIEMLAKDLNRALIIQALTGEKKPYEL